MLQSENLKYEVKVQENEKKIESRLEFERRRENAIAARKLREETEFIKKNVKIKEKQKKVS